MLLAHLSNKEKFLELNLWFKNHGGSMVMMPGQKIAGSLASLLAVQKKPIWELINGTKGTTICHISLILRCRFLQTVTSLESGCVLQLMASNCDGSSTLSCFGMVPRVMVHLMTERQPRLSEMYLVFNQTHHPILRMPLLITI